MLWPDYVNPTLIKDTMSYKQLSDSSKIEMRIVETDISSFPNGVKLKVLVYDSLGNFITNLAPPFGTNEIAQKYFKDITEVTSNTGKKVKFTVKEIHQRSGANDISLVLDYSGSMGGTIKDLEDATEIFINLKKKDDNYSISKFDEDVVVYSKLINNKNKLLRKANFNGNLDTLGGGTAIYAGLNNGITTLRESRNKRLAILFTDGRENASMSYAGVFASNINDIVDSLRKLNTHLIVIGYGEINSTLMRELSYYSNGTIYQINKPQEIEQVYREINQNLDVYYELTMEPLDETGEHIVQLQYFNNFENDIEQRPYYIGNSVDFLKFETDTTAYWYDTLLIKQKYKLAMAPQGLVNFDLDKSNIRPIQKKILNNLAKYIKKTSKVKVFIYGHTDTRGSKEYNKKLSEQRAKAVYKYFINKGVSSSKLEVKAYGEEIPIWVNDDEEWQSRENRRVEIVIWKK